MLSEILCLLFHLMYFGGYILSQNIQICLFFSFKLKYNSHTIKRTTLIYSVLPFNICTKLCNYYHSQIPVSLNHISSSYLVPSLRYVFLNESFMSQCLYFLLGHRNCIIGMFEGLVIYRKVFY